MDYKNGRLRGIESESRVEIALQHLKDAGIIKHFKHVEQNSYYDRIGIDFFIWDLQKRRMPLQVKSSKKLAAEFRRKDKTIPVIVPSDDRMFADIERLMQRYFSQYPDGHLEYDEYVNAYRRRNPELS